MLLPAFQMGWHFRLTGLSAFVVLSAMTVMGQNFTYLDQPTPYWQTASFVDQVTKGNGLFFSPDGSMLIATTASGVIQALDPQTGTQLWFYEPNPTDQTACLCGVTFNTQATTPYLVYAVVDKYVGEYSPNATSRVIALTMDGSEYFVSTSLPGVAAGTPVTSANGQMIFLTHNVAQETGHFTILDTSLLSTSATSLAPLFSQNDTFAPFSPIGFFHNPAEGYFTGAEDMNTNDVFIWGSDIRFNQTIVSNSAGQMYAFQLSRFYGGGGVGLNWTAIGPLRDFVSSNPPILTNSGRSLYWSVSKSDNQCWVGSATSEANNFARGRTNSVGFGRGRPAYLSARAPPSLTSNTSQPTVYGQDASPLIWRMNYLYTPTSNVTMSTVDLVYSRVLISPQEDSIYYATVNGLIFRANGTTLETIWGVQVTTARLEGQLALNAAGTILYMADTQGMVQAYQVADRNLGPTVAPSPAPTSMPASGTVTVMPSVVKATTSPPSAVGGGGSATTAPVGGSSSSPPTMTTTTIVGTTMPSDTSGTSVPSAVPTMYMSDVPSSMPSTPGPSDIPSGVPVAFTTMTPSFLGQSGSPSIITGEPSTMPTIVTKTIEPTTAEPTVQVFQAPSRRPVSGPTSAQSIPTVTPTLVNTSNSSQYIWQGTMTIMSSASLMLAAVLASMLM